MKYANAMRPERTNATGRVKSPRISAAPPVISRMPAIPGSDRSWRLSNIATWGAPKSFAVPWAMKR